MYINTQQCASFFNLLLKLTVRTDKDCIKHMQFSEGYWCALVIMRCELLSELITCY